MTGRPAVVYLWSKDLSRRRRATLRGAKQASTRRVYDRILRGLAAEFDSGTVPDQISAERSGAVRRLILRPVGWRGAIHAVDLSNSRRVPEFADGFLPVRSCLDQAL